MTEAFNVGANGHLYVGAGLRARKQWSVGERLGIGGSLRQQQVAFDDINGDGLVDQIVRPIGSEPHVLLNQARPGAIGGLSQVVPEGDPGAGAVLPITVMRQLGRDVNFYFNYALQAFFEPVSASVSWGRSISSGRVFLTDLDGDGFLDLFDRRDGNRYGHLRSDSTGAWSYAFDSNGPVFNDFTSVNASSDSSIAAVSSGSGDKFFVADPVRRFVAPYSGTIRLEAVANRLRAADVPGADGAYVDVWRSSLDPNGQPTTILVSGCGGANAPCRVDLAPLDLTLHRITPNGGLQLSVARGDVIYLRTGTNSNVPYQHTDGSPDVGLDAVNAAMRVIYSQYCDSNGVCAPTSSSDLETRDPSGGALFAFDTASDFRLAGGMPAPYQLPVAGHVVYHGQVNKSAVMGDNVRVCVQLFHPEKTDGTAYDGFTTDVPCGASREFLESLALTTIDHGFVGTMPLDVASTARAGDLFLVRLETDLMTDPAALSVVTAPGDFKYTATCDASGNCRNVASNCCAPGSSATSCSPDDTAGACACLDASRVQGFVPMTNDRLVTRPFPWIPTASGQFIIAGYVSSDHAGGFIAGVRDQTGALLAKQTMNSCVPGQPCTFSFYMHVSVTQGVPVFLDVIATPDASGMLSPIVSDAWWTPDPPPNPNNVIWTRIPYRAFLRLRPDDLFGGGYRGFSYFAWNEATDFTPHMVPTWSTQDEDAVNHAHDQNSSDGIVLQIPTHIQSMHAAPNGSSIAPGVPAWVAPSDRVYLSTTDGHAARSGGQASGACGADNVDLDSGLAPTDYGRLAASMTWNVAGGLGSSNGGLSINASLSGGWTHSTTDVFDVDGDGIADAITDHGIERGVITRDGRTTVRRDALPQSGPFRSRTSRGFSIGLGVNPLTPDTSPSGRPLSVQTRMPAPSGGVGLAVERNITTADFIDINGDGLPDRVTRDPNKALSVELNLGHRFAQAESLDIPLFGERVDDFALRDGDDPGTTTSPNVLGHETTLSTSFNVGFAGTDGEFGGSLDFNLSSTRSVSTLADINGDGLPDMVFKLPGEDMRVAFNLGDGFTPALRTWTAGDWGDALDSREVPKPDIIPTGDVATALGELVGPDVVNGTGRLSVRNGSRAFEVGGYFTITIPTTPILIPYLVINPGLSASFESDEYQLALMDVDGDGSPDHVVRRADRQAMYVKRNQVTGREGLLSAIVSPFGGTISLDYERTANTVDMPHARHVLSRVEVDDGVELGAGFESPNVVETIHYDGGYYDRAEADFFGFAHVIVDRMDGSATYTRTTMSFENRDYSLRGTMLHSTTVDGSGHAFDEVVDTYAVVPVRDSQGNDVVADASCVSFLPPRLPDSACLIRFPARMSSTHRFPEGDDPLGPKENAQEWTNYDRFGNVLRHVDHGDEARANDDVTTTIHYQDDESDWIVSKPTSVVATSNDDTPVVRVRSATYDSNGNLLTISVSTGSAFATTTLEYDDYGNAKHVETPPDEFGQSQTYAYVFDSTHHLYPTSVTDSFGLESTATYDLHFGLPLVSTDANASVMSRTYDPYGRLASVRGPYDGTDDTVSIAYSLAPASAGQPGAIATTVHRASPPPGYTGPTPPDITTIVVADGFGEAVQQTRSAVVAGIAGSTSTTRGARDRLGREVLTWNPSFAPEAPSGFVTPTPTFATTRAHDVLDRVVQTRFPDTSVASTQFGLALDPSGTKSFRHVDVDGNGHSRESYFAREQALVALVEHPDTSTSATTSYRYDGFGDLIGITDAEGNVSAIGYDARGLMTTLANPDTGLIETTYDLMGNATYRIDPNQRANQTSIHYVHDRGRLIMVDYPAKTDVVLQYGPVGAPNFGAGRVVHVTDETGAIETRYGALGEVVHERRIVNTSTGPGAYGFETSYVHDSLDRLLAMTYPDGEVVTNAYDQGGMLASVVGVLDAATRIYASAVEYDVFGHRTRLVSGNGVESTWNFDPRMARLAATTTMLSGNRPAQALTYGYDAVGNLTSMRSSLPTPTGSTILGGPGTWSMTYDDVDQLRTAIADQEIAPRKVTAYSATFAYSPSHNLLTKRRENTIREPGGAITHPPGTQLDLGYVYASGRPHAPSLVGDLMIAYDPSGNQIERTRNGSVQELVWDDDGRLAEVHQGGTFLRNEYDAAGTRVIKRGRYGETLFVSPYFDHRNGVRGTKHIFAGTERVASVTEGFDAPNVDASGTYTGVCGPPGQGGTIPGQGGTPPGHCPPYVPPAPSGPGTSTVTASPSFPPRTYYFHLDRLGSTSVLTDTDGAVHEYLEYFPDGEVWIDGGPQTPVNGYRFSGKTFDPETGWYDFPQRFYDPSSSLWISPDPAILTDLSRGRDPRLLSAYSYANNSPILLADPDGRRPDLPGHEASDATRLILALAMQPSVGANLLALVIAAPNIRPQHVEAAAMSGVLSHNNSWLGVVGEMTAASALVGEHMRFNGNASAFNVFSGALTTFQSRRMPDGAWDISMAIPGSGFSGLVRPSSVTLNDVVSSRSGGRATSATYSSQAGLPIVLNFEVTTARTASLIQQRAVSTRDGIAMIRAEGGVNQEGFLVIDRGVWYTRMSVTQRQQVLSTLAPVGGSVVLVRGLRRGVFSITSVVQAAIAATN